MKKVFFAVLTIFLISAVISFFSQDEIFLGIINISFLIGMGFLVIGGLMKVVESGFFNGIQYAFKRFRKSSKEGSYIAQFDDMDDTNEAYKEFNKRDTYPLTMPLLLSGGIAVAADLAVSYLFYT
ncbi:DUF3899 domain-containing protein [Rossellomorea vietnamensis]|uniref:DUF3899 domain-containing protein n=1 Tax=Rossellomorea vietnamensis TaxID=218284 RepID=A0A5D4NPK9_9BACI|nr:DUF3899 domain-containing protein [Rossellomorea vietnamensis]TYS15830.1 DUF3899 domain-containing protein [Rossellomorea vietnamensis]